jgi:hypothetical protein
MRVVGGAEALRARVNDRPVEVRARSGRTLIVQTGGRPLRELTLRSLPGMIRGRASDGVVKITLRGGSGSRGVLEVQLRGS